MYCIFEISNDILIIKNILTLSAIANNEMNQVHVSFKYSRRSLAYKPNRQWHHAGLVVQQGHKQVQGKSTASSSSSVQGVIPAFYVIICSYWQHEHAPAFRGPYSAVYPGLSDVVDKLLQWLCGRFWSQTLQSGFDCLVRKEGQCHKSSDVATCRMISGVHGLQSQLLHLSPKGLVPVECTAQQLHFREDFTKCPHTAFSKSTVTCSTAGDDGRILKTLGKMR